MAIWKPIVGYEGFYEVSDQGDVRSIDRTVLGKNGTTRNIRGKILSAKVGKSGYPEVNLSKFGEARMHKVARIVLESFVGTQEDGAFSCHNNGIRSDNRLENLRWDTPSANSLDRRKHGTDHEVNKTECPRGHAYVPENLDPYHLRRQHRICLSCTKARHLSRKYGLDFESTSDQIFQHLTRTTTAL